jgi:hypothetical protein
LIWHIDGSEVSQRFVNAILIRAVKEAISDPSSLTPERRRPQSLMFIAALPHMPPIQPLIGGAPFVRASEYWACVLMNDPIGAFPC